MTDRRFLGAREMLYRGKTYAFRLERDKRMLYVVAKGGEEGARMREHEAANEAVIRSLLGNLVEHGKATPIADRV